MSRSVKIADMGWTEYADQVRGNGAIVLLPIGSTQAHAPNLPIGGDSVISSAIAESIARILPGLVAPVVSYGYKSHLHTSNRRDAPGAVCLDGNTLIMLVQDLIMEFARHGAKHVGIIDAHYESHWSIVEAIEEAMAELRRAGVTEFKVVKARYYEFCAKETIQAMFGSAFVEWTPLHVRALATAILLHVRPELVNSRDYSKPDVPTGTMTAKIGEAAFNECVHSISKALQVEFGLHQCLSKVGLDSR